MDMVAFNKMPNNIPREELPEDHWARKLSHPGEMIPKGVLLMGEEYGEITDKIMELIGKETS